MLGRFTSFISLPIEEIVKNEVAKQLATKPKKPKVKKAKVIEQ